MKARYRPARRPKSTPRWRSRPAVHRPKKPLHPPNDALAPRPSVSQAEEPDRLRRAQSGGEVTVEDVRRLMGASTPHFALQLRNRIAKLIAGLPADHPARILGEEEIARLTQLGFSG